MTRTILSARVILALAFAGSALQYLRILPIVGPPWYPAGRVIPIAAGILLLAAAIGLLVRATTHLAAVLLGAALLLRVLAFHLPQLITHLRDPNIWTGFGEMLALAAGAWLLVAGMWMVTAALPSNLHAIPAAVTRPVAVARYLFAGPLVIFGILHFMYAFFISTLIPAWIPQRFFFANFVGLCFMAAALAIASGIRARLASYLLAVMFLIWMAIVHAPRVAAATHNGNEWTSMFVALAMAGSALASAASSIRTKSGTSLE